MIFVAILLLVAGFVALVKGADVFVDGAAALAGKFGIPQLVIGLTIVAMGTSVSCSTSSSSLLTILAVIGASPISLRMLLAVPRLAFSSSSRPVSTKAIIIIAESK